MPNVLSRWQVVADALDREYAAPTEAQARLARSIEVDLGANTPEVVAAAVLADKLQHELGLFDGRAPSDAAREYADGLAADLGVSWVRDGAITGRELDAWIAALHDRRASRALRDLQPEIGDIVSYAPGVRAKSRDIQLAEVSSIGSDGCLYFKGGRGRRARPHSVAMRCRASDGGSGYERARLAAREAVAAGDRTPETIGATGRALLMRWRVDDRSTVAGMAALRDALETATDEAPLQHVLEKFPELLTTLIDSNHGAYLLPRPTLGGRYIPDFLIAGETSLGIRWTLVELESPTTRLKIANGQYSRSVRNAIEQISTWRDWLRDNQHMARVGSSEGGLGLAGIRSDARGLVIVGRALSSSAPDLARLRTAAEQGIEIRTYDWLLRSANRHRLGWGALDFEGGHEMELQDQWPS